MRGVQLQGRRSTSWLFDRENVLLVNGVYVLPLVEAELNRRFPGRAERRAADPGRLRAAWVKLDEALGKTTTAVSRWPPFG